MFDFSNQVVMITGAVGNLAAAVAQAFLTAQANLVLVDRAIGRMATEYPKLVGSPDHFLAEGIDLTQAEQVAEMMTKTIERFGRVDVLVNTAGGFRGGTPLHETPLETWDFLINLNGRTTFIACQAVIPHMLKQGRGKIVNVAARVALNAPANLAAYSASKSTVVRLTEGMAAELKEQHINVNCILPGTIDTPQNRQAMPQANQDRWVTPESMAEVILFLASEAARDIHGAAVPVYGRS
jgi:NAD(P)-dependent dehydrogenase (short-subunit alcohol dehydrogenase family)